MVRVRTAHPTLAQPFPEGRALPGKLKLFKIVADEFVGAMRPRIAVRGQA